MDAEHMDNVKFRAVRSKATNCVCEGCHKVGRVLKITIPETKYYDGKTLETRYSELWLCHSCEMRLCNALMLPDAE